MSNDETERIIKDNMHLVFLTELSRAIVEEAIDIPPDVRIYVHNLMLRFHRADKVEQTLKFLERGEAIAPHFLEARRGNRLNFNDFNVLVSIGDFCLMFTGYWWGRFTRSVVGQEYYYRMGGFSYGLASRYDRRLEDTFLTLASRFPEITGILSNISMHLSHAGTDRDILTMMETWALNKSPGLRKELIKRGIDPAAIPARVTKRVM